MFNRLNEYLFGSAGRQPQPLLPSPATRPPAAVSATPINTDQSLKRWSHPFRDRRDPLTQLTHMAKAKAGFFPLGVNGMWHGGVHFDTGTGEPLVNTAVHCMANGEIVAYRIDQQSPTTSYLCNGPVLRPFSRNFVLVRHRLQAPPITGSKTPPPTLTFFSLYMHLEDWAVYAAETARARPAFWPQSPLHKVKASANDSAHGRPQERGLNVRNQPRAGKVIDLLPQGAEVVVSGTGDYRQVQNSQGPRVLQNDDGSLRGYVYVGQGDHLQKLADDHYRVKADSVRNSAAVYSEADRQSSRLMRLPEGTELVVSGEGDYRKLEHIQQYVYHASLESTLEPQAFGQVVIPLPRVPIKAGDLIGHVGQYQDCFAEQAERKLHLEVFSADDLPGFIGASRAWAKRLPSDSRTWLKLPKGTPVVPHDETFSLGWRPYAGLPHSKSDADLLVPKSLLDALPAERKHRVPTWHSVPASTWYRLDGLLHDENQQLLSGWVCEQEGLTQWVSPWDWEGYDILYNYDSPRMLLAAFHRATDRFGDAEHQRFGSLADAGDKGPIKNRLYDLIDRNRDGKITAQELQAAMRLPASAQSISRLILESESEWHYNPHQLDGMDELLGHSNSTPHVNWLAEKERCRQMSWWKEVSGLAGLPEDGRVYHLHPVGMMGDFSTTHLLAITAEQLKQIFPAAEDTDIHAVLEEINDRLVEFKLDTRLRQRHFFAQIKGEVGATMKGVTESWEYSPAALKSFSIYYRSRPEEAEADGYLKDASGRIVRRANQVNIGRKHFQKKNGNRSTHPDDGYVFRGRGLIQITGHEKYSGFMQAYSRYWNEKVPDTVLNPELVNEMPNAIRSATWF